ncbi:AAA family ATPase [Photobacterium leiognathi subsp. mandapamensis]
MKLNEVRIEQLFGHFDHIVPFNHEEKITIITAPNGYGKTMILKILHSIFNKKLSFVKQLEFKKIFLIFDEYYLSFSKTEEFKLNIDLCSGHPDGSSEEDVIKSYSYESITDVKDINLSKLAMVDDIIPHLERVDRTEWFDHLGGEILSLTELVEKYDELSSYIDFSGTSYPEWLTNIISSINVHIVQDQRLILRSEIKSRDRHHGRRGKQTIDTIEKYSVELSRMISSCNASYSEVSKRLDGSLPTRLLSKHKKIQILDSETLTQKLNSLREKNERLKNHSLLTTDGQFIPDIGKISSGDAKILSLYVQDNTEKLSVYDDLLSRIELFTDILNNKGLAFKKVSVNPEDGFVFINDSGKKLKLTQLSSGEQHEVVLVYELIFIAKDNDLVLIDEPEISLHIAWQKEFLEDIKRIIDIQNVSIIIATHSPQIIDNNWDLTVDLEGE